MIGVEDGSTQNCIYCALMRGVSRNSKGDLPPCERSEGGLSLPKSVEGLSPAADNSLHSLSVLTKASDIRVSTMFLDGIAARISARSICWNEPERRFGIRDIELCAAMQSCLHSLRTSLSSGIYPAVSLEFILSCGTELSRSLTWKASECCPRS